MARFGTANYMEVGATTLKHDQFWRDCMSREEWNHPFHARAIKVDVPNYRGLNTTSNDTYMRPWLVQASQFPIAAGQASFTYDPAKHGVSPGSNKGSRARSQSSSSRSGGSRSSSTTKLPRISSSGTLTRY
mmetsp:Transcript_58509/g.156392  ORF Transcript_58509/g.156392 Transcript_58509/m.156392 type:complete len:131 (+) Transcript_58509:31-423(+)